jgi:hypothetical protein
MKVFMTLQYSILGWTGVGVSRDCVFEELEIPLELCNTLTWTGLVKAILTVLAFRAKIPGPKRLAQLTEVGVVDIWNF